MRQIMCVHLSRWPIDRLRRKSASAPDAKPLVLIETIASRQLVVTASDTAAARGVGPGMTLAEARALCPALEHAPYQPDRDLRALEALARWMIRFSPIVSIDAPRAEKEDPYLPAVFLDVTGCQRLFGGLPNLIEQVDQAMRSLRLHARIAIAPTPGSAWVFAFAGRENGCIIPPDRLRQFLEPLPPIALRIDPEAVQYLNHLGIETIGQLLQLPRESLPARFGSNLLLRIDQALGRVPEPLLPIPHPSPIVTQIDFDGAVDSLEALWIAFKGLIARVIKEFKRRGCGARKIQLSLFRAYAPTISREILLSRPSRDPRNLFNLIRCAMEEMEKGPGPGACLPLDARPQTLDPVYHSPGFTGIRLSVPLAEKIADEQILLNEQEEHDAQMELNHLIERLVLRLGEQAVAQAKLVESYLPERACIRVPTLDYGKSSAAAPQIRSTRPLHLLACPLEIAVMVSPSHDRDGRPVSINQQGRVRRVVHAVGPERIAGQWWEGHNKTRDYFAVEDETGRRSWVFRVQETGKWYLHGNFE